MDSFLSAGLIQELSGVIQARRKVIFRADSKWNFISSDIGKA